MAIREKVQWLCSGNPLRNESFAQRVHKSPACFDVQGGRHPVGSSPYTHTQTQRHTHIHTIYRTCSRLARSPTGEAASVGRRRTGSLSEPYGPKGKPCHFIFSGQRAVALPSAPTPESSRCVHLHASLHTRVKTCFTQTCQKEHN